MSDMQEMQSMTPLQLAQHLLADVTNVRDRLIGDLAQLDQPDAQPEERARISRNKASLQGAIDGANDQIGMFQQRVAELSGVAGPSQ